MRPVQDWEKEAAGIETEGDEGGTADESGSEPKEPEKADEPDKSKGKHSKE